MKLSQPQFAPAKRLECAALRRSRLLCSGIWSPSPPTQNPKRRRAAHSKRFAGFVAARLWPRSVRAVQRRGFTLIELMVVMVLIGIVTAMIIPEMKGTYEDALLRSTSRELVNVFNLAYSRAVTLNQTHRVRLQEVSGRYITEARTSGRRGVDEFLPLRDLPGSQGELDTRISVAIHHPETSPEPVGDATSSAASGELPARAGEGAIAFYPDGTADGAEVELRDRQGFRLALRINSVTARVHIVELPRQ